MSSKLPTKESLENSINPDAIKHLTEMAFGLDEASRILLHIERLSDLNVITLSASEIHAIKNWIFEYHVLKCSVNKTVTSAVVH